jgi:hypothetical protein
MRGTKRMRPSCNRTSFTTTFAELQK